MSFEIECGVVCLTGKRDINEDFAAIRLAGRDNDPLQGITAAIADGVSEGGGGLEAAQTTVKVLLEDFASAPPTWETSVALDRILQAQNEWLFAQNRRSPALQRATTLTAIVLRGQTYTIAHIGDTRAYLIRAGQLERLTSDHVRSGSLRGMLTRALGLDERVLIDYQQGNLQVDDRVLLVSDGVWSVLTDRQLRELIAQAGTAQSIAERIAEQASAKGSSDNLTAMLIRIVGLPTADLRSTQARARSLGSPRKMRIGETIDGLVVTQIVADNGVNIVYQVREPTTRMLFALKAVHPNRAADIDEVATLAHEAWLAERLDGAQFVRSHRRDQTSELYILYDWHSGQTLERWLEKAAPLPIAAVLDATLAVLKGLGRMHRLGIVHRDIKPANLHRDDAAVIRLIDMGTAVSGAEPESIRLLHAGTPSYMNPEQWEGQPADSGSDLFALGVTLYRLLTGRLPYGDIEPYQLARYRKQPTTPSRLRPEVGIWLDAVILKAIARDPKGRFETAEEFALAIERGASRPLIPAGGSPLMIRDRVLVWQIACGISVFVNLLLILLALTVGR